MLGNKWFAFGTSGGAVVWLSYISHMGNPDIVLLCFIEIYLAGPAKKWLKQTQHTLFLHFPPSLSPILSLSLCLAYCLFVTNSMGL